MCELGESTWTRMASGELHHCNALQKHTHLTLDLRLDTRNISQPILRALSIVSIIFVRI